MVMLCRPGRNGVFMLSIAHWCAVHETFFFFFARDGENVVDIIVNTFGSSRPSRVWIV